MNTVQLIGRLVKNPEVRYSQSENTLAIGRYTLAVERRFKRPGEQEADFITCVAFGKLGENAEKYLKQGSKIAVTGRIQTGSYTNKEGIKVYTTEIIVENQEFLEPKENGVSNHEGKIDDGYMMIPNDMDEELPFN